MKNCNPQEGPTLEKFMENSLPWVGPHAGAGEECEEEGAAETMCGKLTTTPFLIPLRCSGGGGRELGSEVEPGKKGRCGEKMF